MYRMLIVDDEQQIVNSLYGLISERFKFEVYRAYSGLEAEELLRRMRFDIIFSDISMPQKSGLELLDLAKRLWPMCHFILLTAYDNFDYAYSAIKYERVDYLLKIESYDAICEVVEKKLEMLENDRKEQEKVLQIGSDLVDLKHQIQQYCLRRILQGLKMPEQKDIDNMQLPLRVENDVIIALGTAYSNNVCDLEQALTEAGNYLRRNLQDRALHVVSYMSSDFCFWIIQPDIRQNLFTQAEEVLFVQEALGQLFQMNENSTQIKLSLICTERFIACENIHTVYQRMRIRAERLEHESGLVFLDEKAMFAPIEHSSDALNFDNIGTLWNMIKTGNRDGFFELFEKMTDTIRNVNTLSRFLPNVDVQAVGLLMSEAVSVYEIPVTAHISGLISAEGYQTGEDWLEAVAAEMNQMFDQRDALYSNADQWVIRYINTYIEKHFNEDITLTLLANEVHYNPSYLSRFYKKHTGETVISHLYDVRIREAKRLLRETGLKISAIAQQCGFCSTRYFNQVSKNIRGILHRFSENNARYLLLVYAAQFMSWMVE